MIDLHTHSSESDGTLTPEKLIRYAKKKGLSSIALTDHDTVAGLPAAEKAARETGIRFIPGIELDIRDYADQQRLESADGEFHMLGLGIREWRGSALTHALAGLQQDRNRRNQAILEAMRRDGIDAEYSELEALAGGKIIGRPHFARLLTAKGRVKNTEEAFQRYLKRGMPYFVPRRTISVREAADLIHRAGGRTIIAHPLTLRLGWKKLPECLENYRDQGVDGIEAWHSNATYRECQRLEELARSLGMIVSAGSDFHGSRIPGRLLGYCCAGSRPIDDSFAAPFLPG
jgi:predicted metal-dependent phosphoesterase TrpH